MIKLKLSLENLNDVFPNNFSQEQIARTKTIFLKRMAFPTMSFKVEKNTGTLIRASMSVTLT